MTEFPLKRKLSGVNDDDNSRPKNRQKNQQIPPWKSFASAETDGLLLETSAEIYSLGLFGLLDLESGQYRFPRTTVMDRNTLHHLWICVQSQYSQLKTSLLYHCSANFLYTHRDRLLSMGPG